MENPPANKKVSWIAVGKIIIGILILPVLFFLTAGTFRYWQAWLYLAVIFLPAAFVLVYFARNDPAFLNRRMQFKEPEVEQKKIVSFSAVPLILQFVLPGLDVRSGWSRLSDSIVLLGAALTLLGYIIVILTFMKNRFASRVIVVEEGQKVITTGPYKLVRHPMYFGTILLYTFSPLALGSYWAVIPALFMIPVLVYRIINEEEVLKRDLPGYIEYTEKTRYRLIPGLW
jgi:protein-S-isoprenylcysteine O-methyltransferase Ste14